MVNAIIVVDTQKDFCEDGSLPVNGGKQLTSRIAKWLTLQDHKSLIVATKDWHVDPGTHFSEHPDYANSWPAHCVAGSAGAEFEEPLHPGYFDGIFYKGEHEAAYSGFEGRQDGVLLDEFLRAGFVTDLIVCGIATDYCVKATVLDALTRGYAVDVANDLTVGVGEESSVDALLEMKRAGARIRNVL